MFATDCRVIRHVHISTVPAGDVIEKQTVGSDCLKPWMSAPNVFAMTCCKTFEGKVKGIPKPVSFKLRGSWVPHKT